MKHYLINKKKKKRVQPVSSRQELMGLEDAIQLMKQRSEDIRYTENNGWKEYFEIVHEIEAKKANVSEWCRVYKKTKSILQKTKNIRIQLNEINTTILNAEKCLLEQEKENNQTLNLAEIKHNEDEILLLASQYQMNMQNHLDKIKNEEQRFKNELKNHRLFLKEKQLNIEKDIQVHEEKLVKEKLHAINIYKMMMIYQELRQKRRHIKNQLKVCKGILKTNTNGSRKIERDIGEFNKDVYSIIQNQNKYEKIYEKTLVVKKEEYLQEIHQFKKNMNRMLYKKKA